MKNVLKNHVIATSGDFGENITLENLRRWIELNGGQWTGTVTDEVTHLVCSTAHWKRRVGAGSSSRTTLWKT